MNYSSHSYITSQRSNLFCKCFLFFVFFFSSGKKLIPFVYLCVYKANASHLYNAYITDWERMWTYIKEELNLSVLNLKDLRLNTTLTVEQTKINIKSCLCRREGVSNMWCLNLWVCIFKMQSQSQKESGRGLNSNLLRKLQEDTGGLAKELGSFSEMALHRNVNNTGKQLTWEDHFHYPISHFD